MTKHLLRDLERLKKQILQMGSMVEESINKAIVALIDRRVELAEEVIQHDDDIDRMELLVEEDCLKILALHQPVATDLRFVISVLKVNNDLERMGDLALNISERAKYVAEHTPSRVPVEFEKLAAGAQKMVRDSLDSLVHLDAQLARDVCRHDDQVDGLHRQMYGQIQKLMQEAPGEIERLIHMLSASRYLERIADLATNIAEDVVFLIEGDIIRHHHPQEGDASRISER